MTRIVTVACLVAAASLSLIGCATPSTTATPMDWNRPFTEPTKPVEFSHDMAIANPPYPRPMYINYMDEPTRFEFHPRNVIYDEPDEGTTDQGADTAAPEQNPVINGVMYVDPNE